MNSKDNFHDRPHIIEGVLDRIIYSSETSDFVVARLLLKGRSEPARIVGSLPRPRPGETLILEGQWEFDKKFGEQFRFHKASSRGPSTTKGIEKYLSSDLIKGIGPEMARRITAKFGDKTLDIIEKEPEKLLSVPGIGRVRAKQISDAFQEHKALKDVMVFLQSHNVSATYAYKIFKKFGQRAIEIISVNPYCLTAEIKGIGFRSADKIAGSLGIDMRSPFRAQAGILHVLDSVQSEGHVYYPRQNLLEAAQELLGVEARILHKALDELSARFDIVIEEDRVYLAQMAKMENSVAAKIRDLLSSPRYLPLINIRAATDWIQSREGIKLSKAQCKAIEAVFDHKVLIITGGPGTGKTTVLRSLIEIFQAKRLRVLLAAPTGRAAKRLAETAGREAKTVHRLLEYSPGEGRFQRNSSRPLETEILILDEVSMIDVVLMHHLLSALRSDTTLVLVGDSDQLPSVGPGNVLADLINSGKVPFVKLDEIFRQARSSLIVTNAHLVNQGRMPEKDTNTDKLSDFYFIEKEDPEECLRLIKEMVARRIPERFGYDPINDIQVLSPMHKGVVGTENLNRELREILNPASQPIKGDRFRIGDRVMQVRNNYEKEVFNGDIGKIISSDEELDEITVDFDGRLVSYHVSELDELVLAYAVTIHKAQGSEYKAVIIPLTTQHYMLLRRNLLYTAITRGKKLVIVLGSQKALKLAVENRIVESRYSALASKI